MSPSTPTFGSLYTLEKVWRIREALLLNITSHSGLGLRKQFLPRIIWSAPAIFFDFHSREIYRDVDVWCGGEFCHQLQSARSAAGSDTKFF